MSIHISKGDQSKYGSRDWARIINSLSGFKSANLVGTISQKGVTNLSIVSSVVHLGANPPLLGYILRPHSESSPRHSFLNILETKAYTINHISSSFYKKAHQTSARFPMDESEFDGCGLTPEFYDGCNAPFVEESELQIGLNLVDVLEIKQNGTRLIVGEVQDIYIKSDVLAKDGYINIEALETVCVSGLDSYHTTKRLERLSYAKPHSPVKALDSEGNVEE